MLEIGINYDGLKIEADEDSVQRYLLQEGDVLIASKGTVKKQLFFMSKIIQSLPQLISLS